ncbi:MAG: ATP-dependent DNA ligase [Bacteroidota bacterium]
MKDFAFLFQQLDQTNGTNAKIKALAEYFQQASDRDKLWTVAILSHRRPRRTVKTTLLREWAAEKAGIPQWLFEETYHIVGDLAETIALLLPAPTEQIDKSLSDWIDFIKGLGALEEEEKKELVLEAWNSMEATERFVFNKLITGGFRMGVSQRNMTKALSKYTGIDDNSLAHRLMGNWTPDTTTFEDLILNENPLDDLSKPYPFYLAYALDNQPQRLGKPVEWQAERKWDGIRAQLIKRDGELFVWSRGEELVTDRFPEYFSLLDELPDGTVIDGEVLPFKEGRPLPFQLLQTRIGRKKPGKKTLEKAPLILMAYDLLEENGADIRELSMAERRKKLEAIHSGCTSDSVLHLSPVLTFDKWEDLAKIREDSRKHHSEGIMLKRKDSPYQSGRKRGDWWKWKVDPLTIDAVMIYAQRGHGRRANLYTDYTFAVWKGEELVPFTKAYSGLTDKEIREVDRFVKANTLERFGPVRSVKAELVFEIAFEGINRSTRHKSGVALRFPRIHRWRQDKPKEEANTLEDLNQLLELYGQ